MKSTPAVFLTSLAVSAFSLTIPLPAATTVLNLFIGEDVSVQHIAQANEELHPRTPREIDGATKKPACPNRKQNTKEEADFKADVSRTEVSASIKRILPGTFLKRLLRATDRTQPLQLAYAAPFRLASGGLLNRSEGLFKLVDRRFL
ncbi:hypothetical protein GCM10023188_16510 [Pontibacter saemangeumensis]|uniref:Uncharacterized protein n=1 Tax=Pontibacter saemangeumensis TaxID=1084525 RepID=A0ABP8LJX6_9BACT